MILFFQQILNGVLIGSVYSLMALGLTLIYGILHIPNFAHGNKYMLGAFISLTLVSLFKINYWLAILLSMVVLALIGLLVERYIYLPLRDQPHINSFIAAIGLLLLLEGIAFAIWGGEWHRFPFAYRQNLSFFGITITLHRLLVIVAAAVLILLLQLFIKKTTLGWTIEAVAQDREGAQLVGINVQWVSGMAFAIGTALAAAASSLIAPVYLVYPAMGSLPLIKAFVVIILGGMGSLPGAVIGGYLLGLIESLAGGYISMIYADLFAFAVLVIVLAIKPTGLFGKKAEG
ncbi:MAG: branched-chain amino acid ABC transporter permease [Thermodesulfobacteriota bacterium]|jgi:branched-chain amino acid transport system permease protein